MEAAPSSSATLGGRVLSDSLRSYRNYTMFGRWAAWATLIASIVLAAIWWAGCNDTTTILPISDGVFTAVSADDSLQCAAIISRTTTTTLLLWSHDGARTWDTARFLSSAPSTSTLAHTKDLHPRLEALTMDWPSGRGIAVGNGGTIALTDDSARTWRILDTQRYFSNRTIEPDSQLSTQSAPKTDITTTQKEVTTKKKVSSDKKPQKTPSQTQPPNEQPKRDATKKYMKSSSNEFRINSATSIFRTASYRIGVSDEKSSNQPDNKQTSPVQQNIKPPESKADKKKVRPVTTSQAPEKATTADTTTQRLQGIKTERFIAFRRISMDWQKGRGIAEANNGIIRITNDFGKTWQGDSADILASRGVVITDWQLNSALRLVNTPRWYDKMSGDSATAKLNRVIQNALGDFRYTTQFKPAVILAASRGLTGGRYCYSFIDTAKLSFIGFDTIPPATVTPQNIALSLLYAANKLTGTTKDTTLFRVRSLSCNHLNGRTIAITDAPRGTYGSRIIVFSDFGAKPDTFNFFPRTLYALTMQWQSGRGLAVGAGGMILETNNNGRTWREIKPYRRSEHAQVLGGTESVMESVTALFCGLTLAFVWQRRRLRRRIETQKTGDPAEENVLALISDNPSDTDKLGFSDTRDAIIGLMNNPDTEPPVNIVINGEWGSGKTSLMAQIKRKIDADDNNISLWFNAWHFQSEGHTLAAFLAQLARALERGYDGRLRWKFQLFRQRFHTMGIIRKGIFLGSLVPISILACTLLLSLEPISTLFGRTINDILLRSLGVESSGNNSPFYELIKRTGEFFTGILGLNGSSGINTPEFASIITLVTSLIGGYFIRREWGSTLETFFKILNINSILGEGRGDKAPDTGQRDTFKREFWNILNAADPTTKLVIFIDDVDRVSGEKIKELLEAINFITDTASKPPGSEEKQSKVYFVIGMSLSEVVRNLDELLGEKTNSNGEVVGYGSRYIEKMVDIVVNIPEPDTAETVLIRNYNIAIETAKSAADSIKTTPDKPSVFGRIKRYHIGLRQLRRPAYSAMKSALPYAVAAMIVFQFAQFSPPSESDKNAVKSDTTTSEASENKRDTMMITIIKSGRNWPDSMTIGFVHTSLNTDTASGKNVQDKQKTQPNRRYSRPSDTVAVQEAVIKKLRTIADSVKVWDSVVIGHAFEFQRKTVLIAGTEFRGGNGWKGIFLLPFGIIVWIFWASDRKRHPDDEETDDGGADPEELVWLFRNYDSAIKDLLRTPRKMKRFANRIRLQYNLLEKKDIPLGDSGQTTLFFEMMLLLESNRAIFALDRAEFGEHLEKRICAEYASPTEINPQTAKRPARFYQLPPDGKFPDAHQPLLDELYKLNRNTQV